MTCPGWRPCTTPTCWSSHPAANVPRRADGPPGEVYSLRNAHGGPPHQRRGVPIAAGAPGHVVWDRFDQEVLGCNYQGYNPKSRETGCDVWVSPEAAGHPILGGVEPKFHSPCWIYCQRPLADTTKMLLMGRWSQEDADEPVAWTNAYQGGRVFYTTLGHPDDFQIDAFNRLLLNAIRWAIGVPKSND